MKMSFIKMALMLLPSLAMMVVACNNEPPECASDEFPPLHCQLQLKSGKKVDSIAIYHVGMDSLLYSGKTVTSTVDIPLDMEDTTFVQVTLVGKTKTVIETEISVIGITSTPELTIENLECGPVYCFRDIEYLLYSAQGYQDTYVIDTSYENRIDSTLAVKYDTVFQTVEGEKKILRVDTTQYYQKYDTTYMYVDMRKTGVEYVTFPMSVDSLHFYKTEVTQEHEVHAKIFM